MYGKSRRTHRREAFVPQHHPCRIPGTNTWQAGIKNGLNYYSGLPFCTLQVIGHKVELIYKWNVGAAHQHFVGAATF